MAQSRMAFTHHPHVVTCADVHVALHEVHVDASCGAMRAIRRSVTSAWRPIVYIVATRSLRPCARCVVRHGRSSRHAARRSRRAVAFPAHGDRWAMHVDPSSNMTNASPRRAGGTDTRWVRSSPHGERCRTRICSVVGAGSRFVSSRRRFIFELGCLVQALGCFVQPRVRFVSSCDRSLDHGSMDHLLTAPITQSVASLSSGQSTGTARPSTLCRVPRPDRRRVGWR
jgi:hypothetical protein